MATKGGGTKTHYNPDTRRIEPTTRMASKVKATKMASAKKSSTKKA